MTFVALEEIFAHQAAPAPTADPAPAVPACIMRLRQIEMGMLESENDAHTRSCFYPELQHRCV